MNASPLKKGTRVCHTGKPEWGVGQLLEDANASYIRVVFEEWKDIKLDAAFVEKLRILNGDEAKSTFLDNLCLPGPGQSRPMVTMTQAKLSLLENYLGGLHGERMKREERDYKDRMRQLSLGWYASSVLEPLMLAGQYQEVVDLAYRLVKHGENNFPSHFEKMAFGNGLKTHLRAREFAEAFCAWVLPEQPHQSAFESFAHELDHLGCAKWPILTAYRYLLHPQTDVLIKPENLRNAADLARFNINYRPELNWLTYAKVMEFYDAVRTKIVDLGPRDNIDVQNFIWCIEQVKGTK